MPIEDPTDTQREETQQFNWFSADPVLVVVGAAISTTNKLGDTVCSLVKMGKDATGVGASGVCLVATAIPEVTQATLVAGAGTVEGGVSLVTEGVGTVLEPVIKTGGFITNLFVGTLQATGGTVASVACGATGAVLAVPAAAVASVKVSCGAVALVACGATGAVAAAATSVGYAADGINYLTTDKDIDESKPAGFQPMIGNEIWKQGSVLTQHCFNKSQSLLTERWGEVNDIVKGPTKPLFDCAGYLLGKSRDSITQQNWQDIANTAVVARHRTILYSDHLRADSNRLLSKAENSIKKLGAVDDPNSSLSLFCDYSASFYQHGKEAFCQSLACIAESTIVPQALSFDPRKRLDINQDKWSKLAESEKEKLLEWEKKKLAELEKEKSSDTPVATPIDTTNHWLLWFCEHAKQSPSTTPEHSEAIGVSTSSRSHS